MASRASKKLDILQGTLDVMVLQTLSTMGPQHGYGIARRIEQVSGDQVLRASFSDGCKNHMTVTRYHMTVT